MEELVSLLESFEFSVIIRTKNPIPSTRKILVCEKGRYMKKL